MFCCAGKCHQRERRPVARTNLHSQHTSMPSWLTRTEQPTCNCLRIIGAWGLNATAPSVFAASQTCLGSSLDCLRSPVSDSPLVLLLSPAPVSGVSPCPPAITIHSASQQPSPAWTDWRSGTQHLPQPTPRTASDRVSSPVTRQSAGRGRSEAMLCYY